MPYQTVHRLGCQFGIEFAAKQIRMFHVKHSLLPP